MFDNFPYSNFHQMNLDWMIKIAKDFLDQYTSIQETITQGLEDLDTKAQQLEALLQAWYDEHSQDIADQLADALADLNEWYTQHQGYLDQILQDNIAAFNQAADQKAAQTIASIPADYTALSTQANETDIVLAHLLSNYNDFLNPGIMSNGYYVRYDTGALGNNVDYCVTEYLPIEPDQVYTVTCDGPFQFAIYSGTSTDYYLTGQVNNNTPARTRFTTPATAAYFRICCQIVNKDSLNIIKESQESLHIDSDSLDNVLQSPANDLVNAGNYATLLPNLNNIRKTSIYRLNFANRSTDIPLNTPFGDFWKTNKVVTLVTVTNYDMQGREVGNIQYFICYDGVFYRMSTGTWEDWQCLHYTVYINVAGHVSPFDDLVPMFLWVNQYDNMTVRIGKKDYYLIGEFQRYYGNDFFDNYDASSPRGIMLTKNVHVIGDAGAKIWFGYDGANQNVHTIFSPFNFNQTCVDGFTLENIDIYARNCRYCVHDDPSDMARSYVNKYINCRMELDNRNNTDWQQSRCIGAGLGRCGEIVIDGCMFRGIDFQGRLYNDIVLVHNDVYDAATTAKSFVIIRNCYLRGGTIGIVYGGPSTQQTDVMINGCSMVGQILKYAIGGNYQQTDNMTITEWNNTNRT